MHQERKTNQNMRNTTLYHLLKFVTFMLLLACSQVISAQKLNTLVLDAGHGGHDTGAKGRNSREKDITLAIVLKLRDQIKTALPEEKVILTRDNDEFVELYRRAKIANENKADLFISIHCNANRSSSPSGSETYVMGLHKSEANLAVAKAENASILLEDNYVTQYDGFDPGSPEGTIFFSMMQNAFLDKSLNFAGIVQKEFTNAHLTTDRGVKQAGFLVLYKTSMPSVLIETAFISNANDERMLRSDEGQNQIVSAIFRAICNYKSSIEKKEVVLAKRIIIPDSSKTISRETEGSGYNTANRQQSVTKSVDEPASPASNPDGSLYKTDQTANPGTEIVKPDLVYRVQYTVSTKKLSIQPVKIKDLGELWYYRQDGLYKYTIGALTSLDGASELLRLVVKKGYKDAFIVPFLNGKRISNEEACKIGGN
jgi:N-acetylmuramoyl-L-alanine amidase